MEFGFTNPILVDSNAGIVAGHGRLLAAKKLGLAEVPVVVLDHLSEIQRRAYVIADNRLSLSAGWNDELLAGELAAIEAEGFDLGVMGFTDDELESLLADDAPASAEPPARKSVPGAPASRLRMPGDVWLIGPHRLICGDCRDAPLSETSAGRRAGANVVITSPPYATQREYDPSERVQAGAARGVRATGSATWPPASRRCWRRTAPTF